MTTLKKYFLKVLTVMFVVINMLTVNCISIYAADSDEITRKDIEAYGGGVFKSDWVGRDILYTWLYGKDFSSFLPHEWARNDNGS